MTEEEIIKVLSYQINMKGTDVYTPINYDAIQGLLDLYNKQKEEIEKLEIENSVLEQVRKNLINRVNMKRTEWHDLLQKYDQRNEQIANLKKEIEELKQANEVFKRYTVDCRELEIEINNGWEDKIRDKINYYDDKLIELAEKEHNWNKMNEVQQMEHQLLKNRYTNYHNVLSELLEEE